MANAAWPAVTAAQMSVQAGQLHLQAVLSLPCAFTVQTSARDLGKVRHWTRNSSSLALSLLGFSPHLDSCGHADLCPLISQTEKAAISIRALGAPHHTVTMAQSFQYPAPFKVCLPPCSLSSFQGTVFVCLGVGVGDSFCPDFIAVTCRTLAFRPSFALSSSLEFYTQPSYHWSVQIKPFQADYVPKKKVVSLTPFIGKLLENAHGRKWGFIPSKRIRGVSDLGEPTQERLRGILRATVMGTEAWSTEPTLFREEQKLGERFLPGDKLSKTREVFEDVEKRFTQLGKCLDC